MGELNQTDLSHEELFAALTYKGRRTEIRISSHAVCLASPVWKKALSFPRLPLENDGPSKASEDHESSTIDSLKEPEVTKNRESSTLDNEKLDEYELFGDSLDSTAQSGNRVYGGNQQPHWARKILDLTEDDADSVLVLLRIAHLQFHKPWRPLWLIDAAAEAHKPGQEGWLTIAWAFDEQTIFNDLARNLLREVTINDKQECLTKEGRLLALSLPIGIVERIATARRHIIESLLQIRYMHVDKYVTAASINKSVCPVGVGENKKKCDAMVYGSLLMSLQSLELWPRKCSTEINMSVNDFSAKLNLVQTLQFSSGSGKSHKDCGMFSYMDEITRVVFATHTCLVPIPAAFPSPQGKQK